MSDPYRSSVAEQMRMKAAAKNAALPMNAMADILQQVDHAASEGRFSVTVSVPNKIARAVEALLLERGFVTRSSVLPRGNVRPDVDLMLLEVDWAGGAL